MMPSDISWMPEKNMTDTITTLGFWFANDPQVYVSGNMFIYYVPGDRLRHISPDVFVVRGVPKLPERRRYLVWEEGKGPDLVIELMGSEYVELHEQRESIQKWLGSEEELGHPVRRELLHRWAADDVEAGLLERGGHGYGCYRAVRH